jgi:beta-ribofuranosylaminobenzene 5'-phosphate synthase
MQPQVPQPSSNVDEAKQRIHVRSNGRLHFGLAEICPYEPNCFAGIGLMIDHSNASVEFLPSCVGSSFGDAHSTRVTADSYWTVRIQSIADHLLANCVASNTFPSSQFDIVVRQSPKAHIGLGSGTQMACTIAIGLAAIAKGLPHCTPPTYKHSVRQILESLKSTSNEIAGLRETLAGITQRGKRSNIGLQGFIEGGFILDRGQGSSDRTIRCPFPSDWPILLVRNPQASEGDSGQNEGAMFERCSATPNPNRIRMLSLASDSIIPSVLAKDWRVFDEFIGQYGQMAGRVFEAAQGGLYRSAQIEQIIQAANRIGVCGGVQSSWGPTVCMVAQDDHHAQWCKASLQNMLLNHSVEIVYAANDSAQVSDT